MRSWGHGQESRGSLEPAQGTKTCNYKSVKTNILINYRPGHVRGPRLSSAGRSLITRVPGSANNARGGDPSGQQ